MWFLKGIQADFRFFSCLTLVQSMHYIFDICVYLSGYCFSLSSTFRENFDYFLDSAVWIVD